MSRLVATISSLADRTDGAFRAVDRGIYEYERTDEDNSVSLTPATPDSRPSSGVSLIL